MAMFTECAHCGKTKPKDRRTCCSLECAVTRSAEVSQQLHDKSGPWWDRWKTGCAMAEPKRRGKV